MRVESVKRSMRVQDSEYLPLSESSGPISFLSKLKNGEHC